MRSAAAVARSVSRPMARSMASRRMTSTWWRTSGERDQVLAVRSGTLWSLAQTMTAWPVAMANARSAFWSWLFRLDMEVRSVHRARFSTWCGGRPAGPRGAWGIENPVL